MQVAFVCIELSCPCGSILMRALQKMGAHMWVTELALELSMCPFNYPGSCVGYCRKSFDLRE